MGSQHGREQRVRLIAFRVSEETAKRRREQVNQHSQSRAKGIRTDVLVGKKRQPKHSQGRHRYRPGKKRVALLEWTILLTNVSYEQLSAQEARVLMRSRWQIELLWRLWKERGQLDIWRSEKPMRILCEIYAKLIGMIIQHWLTLVGCWQQPHRSMVKASQVVQMLAVSYALSLLGPITSTGILQASQRAMRRCRLNPRKKRPNTSPLLLDPRLGSRLG